MIDYKYLKAVCKGICGALILCLFGFTVLSVIIEKMDIGRGLYNIIYVCIALISLSIGSIIAAKKNGCRGWLTGFGVGIGYYFILFFVCAVLIKGLNFQSSDILKLIASAFIGTISGILGINL